MKVWFCRDEDGTPTVWDGERSKPVYEEFPLSENGWVSEIFSDQIAFQLSEGKGETENMFGVGCHGVRKGQCKLLDLAKSNWISDNFNIGKVCSES